jgi:hypothetical protein
MTKTETEAGTTNGGGKVGVDIKALIDQAADLREEAKRDHHLDRPIPGLKGLVWARYRAFSAGKTEDKTNEYQRLQQRGGRILLIAACDTLIDACEQLMVLPPEFDGDPGIDGTNLIPVDDTVPVAFDQRCAELFIKDETLVRQIKEARQVVLAMFPTDQSILAENVAVTRWMQDVTQETDAGF